LYFFGNSSIEKERTIYSWNNMRNKIFLTIAVLISSFCYCDDRTQSEPVLPPVDGISPPQTYCTNLSPDESAFSDKLSALHQVIFCQLYGPDLRAQAMAFITASSLNKSSGMTNDMAVEMTLKNCRGMKTLPDGVTPYIQSVPGGQPQGDPQAQPKAQPPASTQPKRKGPCALIPKGT